MTLTPKYVTFDLYGTLIDFQFERAIRNVLGERLLSDTAREFYRSAAAYRFDEVLGAYKPYRYVIQNALRRTCARHRVEYRSEDAGQVIDAIVTWPPHIGVVDAIAALAERYPLVILSNADDEQLRQSVAKLGVSFAGVFSSQQSGHYKPRLASFEYMLRRLNCNPNDIVHVSSNPKYDLRPAHELGIQHTVLLERWNEPPQPWLGYQTIHRLSDLSCLLK